MTKANNFLKCFKSRKKPAIKENYFYEKKYEIR